MTDQPTAGSNLAKRVIALAGAGHPDAASLRAVGRELDDATRGFFFEPATVTSRQYMGAYMRAGAAYQGATGEPA